MENKKNITVFGATGKIGAELLQLLSKAGVVTTAVTRDINKAIKLPHVEWIEADMADRQSLYKTMKDNESVFLLSAHTPNFVIEQGNVIEVAKAQGVKHILKLSSGAADKDSPYLIARVHGAVEELLRQSNISSTFLRPNGFMQNWLGELAYTVKTENKIYDATGLGKRAYIDMRDIAEVAFAVLHSPQKHANHAYLLTSDIAVNYEEVAIVLREATGRKVEYIQLTIDEARARMEQKGLPPYVIAALLSYAEDQRNGKTAFVSGDVKKLLHKPARTIADFVNDYASCFS